jgi:hypothetical protein
MMESLHMDTEAPTFVGTQAVDLTTSNQHTFQVCYGDNTKAPAQSLMMTWQDLIDMLRAFGQIERLPTNYEKENNTPWISPMILKPGETKKLKLNIGAMANFICIDLDSPGWSIERIYDSIGEFSSIIYTTTKSIPTMQRWRIIMKASRCMTATEYVGLWHYLNTTYFAQDIDQATKNENRLSFVPAKWAGADNVFFVRENNAINIDELQQHLIQPVMSTPTLKPQLLGNQTQKAIFTTKMITTYNTSDKGKRLYKLMAAAAARHKINGWALDAVDLAAAALDVSLSLEPDLERIGIEKEAEKAIGWADLNIETLTPMEKIRSRILFATKH